jgi:hypothetical protein
MDAPARASALRQTVEQGVIEIVSPILVDRVWPLIQEGMQKACRKGGNQFSEAWLHVSCRRGDAYLCVLHEDGDLGPITMSAVVQEQQWLNRQVLYVLAIAGTLADERWMEMANWARQTFPGCQSFVFEGRAGWGRFPGVKTLRHVYEMDVANGQQRRTTADPERPERALGASAARSPDGHQRGE